MSLLTLTQISCHHVLANEIALNLKYRIGLKHFFNINLGIGIIKKTTFFVCIFNISPRFFTQISIRRARWIVTFFSGISCFWGSRAHQKYAEWVLIGGIIEFRIQQALPIEI